MLEVAEAIKSKDEATTKKPLLDALKWSAEKTNPDQYGVKQKVTHDGAVSGPMIVVTGVPAPENIPEKDVTPPLDNAQDIPQDETLSGGIEAGGGSEAITKDD
jgi:hypothetical protein